MKGNFKCQLKLKGDGGELTVKCENTSNVSMNIFSYGFSGQVTFVVDKEEKWDFFSEPGTLDLVLTVESVSADDGVEPFEFQGIVREGTLEELVDLANQSKIDKRVCQLEFCDPAQEIWSRHYCVEIFTDKTLEDVINSYISERISIKYDSPNMKEERKLIALGLGDERNSVDFYAFLMGLFQKIGDTWEYDYAKKQYVIREEKDSSAEPIKLPFDSGPISRYRPQQPRHNMRVVNSHVKHYESSADVEGVEVYEGITRDYLLSTPLPADVEKISEKIKPKPNTREHPLKINFDEYPPVNMFPGNLYSFQDHDRKTQQWGKELWFKEKIFRLHSLFLVMNAFDDSLSKESPADQRSYEGVLKGIFEQKEEVHVLRPPNLRVPYYPFPLDGTIFSEEGKEKEITHDIKEDEETKQPYYTIEIPSQEKQKVRAPVLPTYVSGQDNKPLLKGQPVRVHFHLFTAEIAKVLEWYGVAKPEDDKQRNKTRLAPWLEADAEADEVYTEWEHVQEDDGTLTWTLKRKQADDQIQQIKIKEDGTHLLVFKREEEADPQCHIHMDNKNNILIQSKNKETTQNIIIQPELLSLLVEKGGDKSTFVQTPKSVTIECQEFTLNTKKTNFTSEDVTICKGKNINIEGSQSSTVKGGSKVDIKSSTINIG